MGQRTKLRDFPGRVATGGYILHSGIGKWHTDADRAAGLHRMACGAFPALAQIPPAQFVKMLSVAEMTTGALLLTPLVPTAVAGAALATFSAGLVTMYLRTPTLRKPGSIWPSAAGTAISKDSWMLAIAVGFLMDSAGRCRAARKAAKVAAKVG